MINGMIAGLGLLVVSGSAMSAEPFWDWSVAGKIDHQLQKDELPVVLNMQGRKVVMECHVNVKDGLEYRARFFNVKDPKSPAKLVFHGGTGSLPVLSMDGRERSWFRPSSVTFDGRLVIGYQPYRGITMTRWVYPSKHQALVLEEWECRNGTDLPVKLEVLSTNKQSTLGGNVTTDWICPAVAEVEVAPGGVLTFSSSVQARRTDEKPLMIDVAAERQARQAMADAAWNGPGRLEVPDPMLVAAYNLQKLHVLETPIETCKGVITHNGSLTYTPGIWANDPVEYSSPLFPFFGSDELNEASMQMYRIWLNHCRENGIDPFPGSFEHEDLRLVQRWRGDDAMVLYGLSKFLLFQGDREAAEELWPLIEYSVASIGMHLTADGIVASKTDEMEGRYPTGEANLSTSALAYGGYIHAAHLARAIGKTYIGNLYDERAEKLKSAIESYFGAEIEGFPTYRYYKENTTLRGWILLPLAMDIWERKEGTLAAMLSDELWPSRHQGGDILAESTRDTEWGRETYYALRVLFKAGLSDQALDLTRKVVRAQIFGSRGPYPDEDAIDMLCPGSLYPRVFTEGVFGIVPTGLDAFEVTPWLPEDWPKMALREVMAFGATWDLVVERDGEGQKVTVTSGGKVVFSATGPAGTTHVVKFSN